MKVLGLVALFSILLLPVSLFCGDSFWAQATFIKGDVKVKPNGTNNSIPLKLGAVLHQGDTVITSEGARASFLMSDGSINVVGSQTTIILAPKSNKANPSLQIVAKNLSRSLLSREGDNPMLKHLGGLRGEERNVSLGPNRTKVHGGNVRLYWLSTPKVSKYIITLMGPGDSIYETTVEGNFIDIPKEKIVTGTTYYWEVRNAIQKDSITALGSGSFTTLDKKEEEAVRALEDNIIGTFQDSKTVEDSTPSFLLYQVYREHEMNLDALLMLERITSIEKDDMEVLRLRKEICKELGIEEKDISVFSIPKS